MITLFIFLSLLQNCFVTHADKVAERDAKRQEVNKVRVKQAELHEDLDLQRTTLDQLVHNLTIIEEEMNRVCRHSVATTTTTTFLTASNNNSRKIIQYNSSNIKTTSTFITTTNNDSKIITIQ